MVKDLEKIKNDKGKKTVACQQINMLYPIDHPGVEGIEDTSKNKGIDLPKIKGHTGVNTNQPLESKYMEAPEIRINSSIKPLRNKWPFHSKIPDKR